MTRFPAALLCLLLAAAPARAETVSVAVAISLQEAMADIAAAYREETGDKVRFTFGSSGQLMAQVRNGAPLDVFIGAADQQVDPLIRAGRLERATRRVVAGNRLVLIVPADAETPPESFTDLADPARGRVAIGEPATVPAGQYAAQVLDELGVAAPLEGRLVYGANVRQVLDYVVRGEVAAGVVYATDAMEAGGGLVRVVATADPETHDPIVYPAAVVTTSRKPEAARRFLEYLGGGQARKVLRSRGFIIPQSPAQAPDDAYNDADNDADDDKAAAPGRPAIGDPFWLSLRIAGAATGLTALVAIPLAFVLARRRFPGKSVLEALITVPLVLPPTVVGYLIILALGSRGWPGRWLNEAFGYSILFGFEGAVLAAATVALPLLYMPAKAAFASVDRELEDIAVLMGAGRLRLFWHVALPLARRGIASGLMLAFARALGEFGATVMVFGWQPGRETLPIAVYRHYEAGDFAAAGASVAVLTSLSFALIFAYNHSVGARRA
jgi:molybdate transport system permease protein